MLLLPRSVGFAVLAWQLAYLFDGARAHSPWLWLAGTRVRRMGAAEAHRLGMVNRVVPRAELEAAATALAEEIAAAPPFAVKLTKRSLNRAADIQGFRSSVMAHFNTHQLAHVSEEFKAMRERGLSAAIARGKARTGA